MKKPTEKAHQKKPTQKNPPTVNIKKTNQKTSQRNTTHQSLLHRPRKTKKKHRVQEGSFVNKSTEDWAKSRNTNETKKTHPIKFQKVQKIEKQHIHHGGAKSVHSRPLNPSLVPDPVLCAAGVKSPRVTFRDLERSKSFGCGFVTPFAFFLLCFFWNVFFFVFSCF